MHFVSNISENESTGGSVGIRMERAILCDYIAGLGITSSFASSNMILFF